MGDRVEGIEFHALVVSFVGPQAGQPSQHLAISRSERDAVSLAEEASDESVGENVVAAGIVKGRWLTRRIEAKKVFGFKSGRCEAQLVLELIIRKPKAFRSIGSR